MYLLVADDLTGGNDAGIQFVKHGIDARLALSAAGLSIPDDADGHERVLAVNANTRNLPAHDAASRVTALAAAIRQTASALPAMVFKKIDSTLRGNIGAETDALMDGFGFATAFLAPSYPQQGRTVVDGDLLVDGVPVHRTIFADDPLTPVREASIAAAIRTQSRRKTGFVPLAVLASGAEEVSRRVRMLVYEDGAECIIFDAKTTEDLACIASVGLAMAPRPLFTGSAGLADALACQLARSAPALHAGKERGAPSPADRVLFLCGSAHQATHTQMDALAGAGMPVIHIPQRFMTDPGALAATSAAVIKALEQGSAVLAAPRERIGIAGDMAVSMALNTALASMALDILRTIPETPRSTALVMTGGETAYALLERLGNHLSLHAELLPGIALCTVCGGLWDGLRVVTKAGGFGGPRTLLELAAMLRRAA